MRGKCLGNLLVGGLMTATSCVCNPTPTLEQPKPYVAKTVGSGYSKEKLAELFNENNRFTWENGMYIPGIWVNQEGKLGELEHGLRTGEIIYIIENESGYHHIENVGILPLPNFSAAIEFGPEPEDGIYEKHRTLPGDEWNVDLRTCPYAGFFYTRKSGKNS